MTRTMRFADLDLWSRRVSLYHAIVTDALTRLRLRDVGIDEPNLNRALYQCIVEVIHDRRTRGLDTLDAPPVYDAPHPPMGEHETTDERKRPDFRWELVDHSATPVRAVVPFVVECKRLGAPVKRRVLVRLYVTEGVVRFLHDDWKYGQNATEGVMVGYVQSLSLDKLLEDVNGVLEGFGLPTISADGATQHLHRGQHELIRSFYPNRYDLHHIWVDLVRERPNLSRLVRQRRARATASDAGPEGTPAFDASAEA